MKPTYLYIKQHTTTGMLYFGKTFRNPETYVGSGKRWINHIKKHGKEHVVNLWYCLFLEELDITEFAKWFSDTHNIVESSHWANLISESGLDSFTGYHEEETRQKIGEKIKIKWQDQQYRDKVISKRQAIIDSRTPEERRALCVSHKDTTWITNGTDELKINNNEIMPNGYEAGRISRKHYTNSITGEERAFTGNPPSTEWIPGKISVRTPHSKEHNDAVSKSLTGKIKTKEHTDKMRLSKQKDKAVLVDHNGNTFQIHTEFTRKYGIDLAFWDDLNSKMNATTMRKLNIPQTPENKRKTKADFGFRKV